MVGRARTVGFDGKPLKSELHHWWPKGLSKFWADEQGLVTRLSWDGKELKWATAVEPIFDDADNTLPLLVEQLQGLPIAPPDEVGSYIGRASAVDLDDGQRAILAEGIASLLIRCPNHRDMLHRSTESFFGRSGDEMHKPDQILIAGNIHHHYRQVVATLQAGGKFVLFRTASSEFIMGEGYYTTLNGAFQQSTHRCLVPLTPTLAVLAFRPLSYTVEPRVSTVTLTDEEVDIVNEVTQICTCDYLFYRSLPPKVTAEFTQREFLKIRIHPWLEEVMHSIAADPLPSRFHGAMLRDFTPERERVFRSEFFSDRKGRTRRLIALSFLLAAFAVLISIAFTGGLFAMAMPKQPAHGSGS